METSKTKNTGGDINSERSITCNAQDKAGNQALQKLKTTIESLCTYVKDRNNVHHEIKRLTRSIRVMVGEVETEMKKGGQSTGRESSTGNQSGVAQTTVPGAPKLDCSTPSGKSTEKRRREDDGGQKKPTPGRKRLRSFQKSDMETTASEMETEESETDLDRTVIHVTPRKKLASKKAQARGQASASEAENKRKRGKRPDKRAIPKAKVRRRKMVKRARPDAIMVEKVGEVSYADILKKVREDPTLRAMGESVVRTRRAHNGQLMFVLRKEDGQKGANFQGAIGKVVDGLATVKVLTQEVDIVCKDLDEITSKEELLEALRQQFELVGLHEDAIRSVRAAYGGTQTAIIRLPMEAARKVLAAGRMKVGWTMCRLREFVRPKSCFRCLDFGHLAKDCKGIDRSKKCRRCGEEGHIAKDCKNDPKCMLCDENGDRSQSHIAGSASCPKYRSAAKLVRP